MDRILVHRDNYVDSVFLMALSAELARTPSLEAGHVVLATPANRQLLEKQGFDARQLGGLGPTDLVIALRAARAPTLDEAEERTLALLAAGSRAGTASGAAERPVGLAGGLAQLPDATLALISVPGEYAALEAGRALDAGLHVMIFSDNVSLEDEVSLKRRAAARGLLVMGPDCGTALVGGKPLGFANRLRPGPIGLVGASGTGLQEVSCQIHRLGGGVSHMLGTGGRDLCAAVGGLTTLAAIDALAADDATRVLVVVSKPPAADVATRVLDRLARLDKPSVVMFLGDADRSGDDRVHIARDLSDAAQISCRLASVSAAGEAPSCRTTAAATTTTTTTATTATTTTTTTTSSARAFAAAAAELDPARHAVSLAPEQRPLQEVFCSGDLAPEQRLVHGLFCGGTLAAEALLLLRARLGGAVSSNLDHGAATAATTATTATTTTTTTTATTTTVGHTITDLGDDELTRGRPHPMIDPTLRAGPIVRKGSDPTTAVLLLDLVLGAGAHADPAGCTAEAIAEARRRNPGLVVISSVTGTDLDRQGLAGQQAALRRAGALVAPSNVAAAGIAADIIEAHDKESRP